MILAQQTDKLAQEATVTDGRSPLASTEEVSEYLQVPLTTVYQWRRKGVGPRAVRVGRHLRYRWEDVDRWLEQQARGGA